MNHLLVENIAKSFSNYVDLREFIKVFQEYQETLIKIVEDIARNIVDVKELASFLIKFPDSADKLIIETKYYDRVFDSIRQRVDSFGNVYIQEFSPLQEKKYEGKFAEGYTPQSKEGLCVEYYSTGQIKSKESWSFGELDWRENYFEDGSLEIDTSNPRPPPRPAEEGDTRTYQEFHENGQIAVDGFFEYPYEADRDWTFYYDNGVIEAEGEVDEGFKNGVWLYYYPDGMLKSCGMYDSRKYGVWTYFYPNGHIRRIEIYNNGTPVGLWRDWDLEGYQHFLTFENADRRDGHAFNEINGYDTDDE